jgi:hypothetical protein
VALPVVDGDGGLGVVDGGPGVVDGCTAADGFGVSAGGACWAR